MVSVRWALIDGRKALMGDPAGGSENGSGVDGYSYIVGWQFVVD